MGQSQVIKRKNRTLLTDKSTRRPKPSPGQRPAHLQGSTLEKIPEKNFKKTVKTNAEDRKDGVDE